MQVTKILLTRDRPEQLSSFLYAVFNGNKPLWDEAAFPKAYHFLKKLANCVDNMLFHCFYDAQNFVSKYFENALIISSLWVDFQDKGIYNQKVNTESLY